MSSSLSPAFASAVEEYKRGYIASRNLAERSREEYETDVIQFLEFVEALALRDVSRIEAKHVKAYLADLDRRKLRSSSRRRKLTVIRTFFACLKEVGRISHDPAKMVRLPLREDPRPRVLSRNEYRRLLRSVEAPRDRAIIQLVLQAGVLLSELHRLNLSDLNLPEQITKESLGTMKVRGSGSRDRVVVLNAKACGALQSWLQERPTLKTDAVFISNRESRLSERQIQNIASKHLNAAAIEDASVHTVRHTFAVHHLAQGTDTNVIQEVLGLESKDSTRVYIPIAKRKQAQYLQKNAL